MIEATLFIKPLWIMTLRIPSFCLVNGIVVVLIYVVHGTYRGTCHAFSYGVISPFFIFFSTTYYSYVFVVLDAISTYCI